MPKYKRGDKVRVVSDLSHEGDARWYMDDFKGYAYVTEEMEDYRGKVVTIDYPDGDDAYFIVEDNNSYVLELIPCSLLLWFRNPTRSISPNPALKTRIRRRVSR